jgi:hypothetical protein
MMIHLYDKSDLLQLSIGHKHLSQFYIYAKYAIICVFVDLTFPLSIEYTNILIQYLCLCCC